MGGTQAWTSSQSEFDNAASVNWSLPEMFTKSFPQTNIEDISNAPLTDSGKEITSKIKNHIGKINYNGDSLGTAIVINKDLVLVPRHCIEEVLFNKL